MLRAALVAVLIMAISAPASAACWNGTKWVKGGSCVNAKINDAQQRLRDQQMQREMEAEQQAYARMKANRQKAPTTEHCYMVNGTMQCKPAP